MLGGERRNAKNDPLRHAGGMTALTRYLSWIGGCALLGVIALALRIRLGDFPGLHGDEAWLGLDAMRIQAHGLVSLDGMNRYSGSLFPALVSLAFAHWGAGIVALRLAGVILNAVAACLMAFTLRKQASAAFLFVLLLASSLLFLFYGRVAWEISALFHLLLALILFALTGLSRNPRSDFGRVFLLLLAFSIGTWTHFMFEAAAVGLAAAALVVAWRYPDGVRVLLLAMVNLALQAVLTLAKFLTPATPSAVWLMLGLGLILTLAATFLYLRCERHHPARLTALVRNAPLNLRSSKILLGIGAAWLAWGLIYETPSFIGALSGYVPMERVASDRPSLLVGIAQHLVTAVLVLAFLFTLRRAWRGQSDPLKALLSFWTIAFLPALAIATLSIPDRYFLIPQFLFFASLALSYADLPSRMRRGMVAALTLGLLLNQSLFWREVLNQDGRAAFHFRYVFYGDTSEHFLKLDKLSAHLRSQGVCRAQSSSFFIAQPLAFLSATGPACESAGAAKVEYCDSCRAPVAGFSITPASR